MPSPRSAPAPDTASSSKGLVVLIHAHEDKLTLKSKLIAYVRAAAFNEGYDFWWDYDINHPNFNKVILDHLEAADLVVCVLSQGFFTSTYIAAVEMNVLRRRIGEGLLVVPVKNSPYASNTRFPWLSELHQVPARVDCIYGAKGQQFLFKEVAEYIQKLLRGKPKLDRLSRKNHVDKYLQNLIRGRSLPFLASESLYTIRQLPNESFSAMEQNRLLEDAKRRAEHYVPDPQVRHQICEAARALGASVKAPLSKPQLAKLDARFLAHKEKREPDPKKIRWVLRAAGLHPQGRAPKVLAAA